MASSGDGDEADLGFGRKLFFAFLVCFEIINSVRVCQQNAKDLFTAIKWHNTI
jgi:hypothetical protein